jgi:hypothetical protein
VKGESPGLRLEYHFLASWTKPDHRQSFVARLGMKLVRKQRNLHPFHSTLYLVLVAMNEREESQRGLR